MKSPLKSHPVYFYGYLLFLFISIIILLLFDKMNIHLYMNDFHNSGADLFFKYSTDLGDGLTLVLVAVALLFISKRMALQVALSGITAGAIAQVLKKVVFGPVQRPSAFFEDLGIQLYYVEGVDLHSAFSFPSGHSTAIFVLMTSLVLIQKDRKFDFLLITLAVLIAYSRIYLSQHFLQDIFAGSIIGSCVAILVYWMVYSNKSITNKKLDSPLINFSTKSS